MTTSKSESTLKEVSLPYELCKLLRDNGFPQKSSKGDVVFQYYVINPEKTDFRMGELINSFEACILQPESVLAAPTAALAERWLRTYHKIFIEVRAMELWDALEQQYKIAFRGELFRLTNNPTHLTEDLCNTSFYLTYEEAEVISIKESLEYIKDDKHSANLV
jgi:hypothetical protein